MNLVKDVSRVRDKHGFFHFTADVLIGDATVSRWLDIVRTEMINDNLTHNNINSGDTAVVGVRHDDYVYFFVMQSNGWAKKVVPWAELATADLTWVR